MIDRLQVSFRIVNEGQSSRIYEGVTLARLIRRKRERDGHTTNGFAGAEARRDEENTREGREEEEHTGIRLSEY